MYYNNDTLVFFDGQWLKAKALMVSPYAQTMHYGSGVFEGIRSYATPNGTRVFKLEEHYKRLLFSAGKMHLKCDYTVEQLTQLTYELLEKNNLGDAYIRPLVFAGANMSLIPTEDCHFMLCAWEWGKYLGYNLLRVMISSYQRPNPKSCHIEAKVTGHYVNSILATTEAKTQGYDEALLLDADGYLAEGPGANLFFEKDGMLYTPQAGNILKGITRATIFELCEAERITLKEGRYKQEELLNADSAFYCGTAAEVAGIESINGQKFKKSWNDSLGKKLQNSYSQLVRKDSNVAKMPPKEMRLNL